MITNDLLFQLFCRHVERLATEKHLTDDEKAKIIKVFKNALSDPYMNEYQIYPQITGDDEFIHSHTIYD